MLDAHGRDGRRDWDDLADEVDGWRREGMSDYDWWDEDNQDDDDRDDDDRDGG